MSCLACGSAPAFQRKIVKKELQIMMTNKYTVAKYACYVSNASMSAVANLSPLLFITFHQLYNISYTLLGLLVLINFCTQLGVDLIFSFYSHKFNIQKTVRIMPVLTVVGLVVYALVPALFPGQAYLFLAIGTVIFSASAGLAEVLISPVIAALPSDNPQGDMSRAHSVYAWGVAVVVLLSTLYLQVFGRETWYILALLWALVPLVAFILFLCSEIPPLETPKDGEGRGNLLHNPVLFLCIACIFLGGASENTMTQWCSGYLEAALGISKLWGDVFGVAVFAVMLGLGRTLYAKFGSNISRFLFLGFAGAVVCYVTAALSQNPLVGLIACALTGFCVSMLWPGTLIYTAELLPRTGVAVYALLAAGGDLGGSIAPQLVGSITDAVSQSGLFSSIAPSLTPEQIGFKTGMLAAALFPLLGTILVVILKKVAKRQESKLLQ